MMSLKVGFSYCEVFWVLGERNREIEEFHFWHTLSTIKLTVMGLQNIP